MEAAGIAEYGNHVGTLTQSVVAWYDVTMKDTVTYTVHVEPCEEGGFWAYFPALPGCQTQGETLEETLLMAKDAMTGYLDVLVDNGQAIPVESPLVSRVGFDLPLSTHLVR